VTAEGLAALQVAAAELPRATLAMAEWHCRHKNLGGCESELKTFLKTPRGPNHEAAEKWLARLKEQITKPRE
jgi:hypothetical protein